MILFVCAMMYADDITILAPTPDTARKTLSICDCYAEEFSNTFNAKKNLNIY